MKIAQNARSTSHVSESIVSHEEIKILQLKHPLNILISSFTVFGSRQINASEKLRVRNSRRKWIDELWFILQLSFSSFCEFAKSVKFEFHRNQGTTNGSK